MRSATVAALLIALVGFLGQPAVAVDGIEVQVPGAADHPALSASVQCESAPVDAARLSKRGRFGQGSRYLKAIVGSAEPGFTPMQVRVGTHESAARPPAYVASVERTSRGPPAR